jgi:PTH1 family peptidyl-tRNA hydrolase
MFKLIVALGNPGAQYEFTRHNIAWIQLRFIDEVENATWKNKFKGEYCSIPFGGETVHFLKPQTFMNLSGESVGSLCTFFKILPSEVLVMHDELDLPFGQIHFKKGGGLAGHNGLKSTAQHLGTPDFYRMRIGIGRPVHGSVSSWVLGKFTGDEEIVLGSLMEKSGQALKFACKHGLQKAANKYNKKDLLT